jgi:fatty-acyl-CoA synthase
MDSLAFNLIHRFNVGDSLRRSAKRYPTKVAVRFEGADTSYAALDAQADRVARFFLGRDIGRGDAVAFLGLNSLSFLAHFFGLVRIGAPFVPINALLRGKEIDYVLSRANVKALVIDPMLSGSLDLESEALSCVRHKFALGSGPAPEGFELMEPILQGVLDDPVECLVENEDTATILFTSGTTAFPKAVMSTHLNYYASFLAAVTDIGITKEDRPLLCLPLFHSAGLFLAFSAVTAGVTSTMLSWIESDGIFRAIEQDKVSVVALPATVWIALSQIPDIGKKDLRSLKTLLVFQYLPTEVLKKWMALIPGAVWINYWGQTEMIPLGASTPPGTLETKLSAPNPVGIPHLPLEIRVVDEKMHELPPFGVGEMVARGPVITPGYLGDQEATEELFMGGWHHTGDMGFKDEEGFLYFVDRNKDMIKSGGENVASQEVEEALSAHPKVAEVAVIGMADPYWVEKVVAIIKTKASETLTQDEVIAFAKTRLASFKAPKEVYFVEDFPRSPSGKVLKRAMKDEIVRQVKKEV